MSEPDLSHHYKVLKQFLDISEDSGTRAKPNSSRALRAREKLLKLSSAQFRELSTDVYDELKRRIDESRAEPEFLLPKSTFHPKRNQARQKLSSLPQTRFKDLVMDISYEISRRNLHIPSGSTVESPAYKSHQRTPSSFSSTHSHPQQSYQSQPPQHQQQQQQQQYHQNYPQYQGQSQAQNYPEAQALPQEHTQVTRESEQLDLNQMEDEDEEEAPAANSTSRNLDPNSSQMSDADTSKQTIAVQPTTVVPTKANLTWSSDEEEEDEKPVSKEPETTRSLAPAAAASAGVGALAGLAGSHMLSNGTANDKEIEELKQALEAAQSRAQELERANEELKTNLASTLSEKDAIEAQHRQLVNVSSNAPDLAEHNALREELESLKQSSAALRLENQALKNKYSKGSRHQSRDLSNLSKEEINGNSSPGRFNSRRSSIASTKALDIASKSSPSQNTPRSPETATTGVDVNRHLQMLHEKMSAMDRPQSFANATRREGLLRTEASKWQQRFQDAQAGIIKRNALSQKPQLQQSISPDGLIPLQSASSFFAAIETFLISLYETTPDPELLFERISNVAFLANKLASATDKAAAYENSHLANNVREAASHSLTATRYFGSNTKLLPRVVVERAVDELAFSACELVSTCKLNDGNSPESAQQTSKSVPSQIQDTSDIIRPLRIGKATNLSPPNQKDNESQPSGGMSPAEGFSTPRSRSASTDMLQPPHNRAVDSPSPAKILPGSLPLNDSGDVDEQLPKAQPAKKLTMFERLSGKKAPADPAPSSVEASLPTRASEAIGTPSAQKEIKSDAAANTQNFFKEEAAPVSIPNVDTKSSNSAVKATGTVVTGTVAATGGVAAVAINAKERENKDNSLTESNTNSPTDVSDGVLKSPIKSPVSKAFDNNLSQNKENVAPSTPQAASRANILDKVRQFESPENTSTKQPGSKVKSPSSVSVKNVTEMLSKDASPSQQATTGAKSNENTPTRSRSLFQTLRSKFAGESTATKNEDEKDVADNSTIQDEPSQIEKSVSKAEAATESPTAQVSSESEKEIQSLVSEPKASASNAPAGVAAGALAGVGAAVGAESLLKFGQGKTETEKENASFTQANSVGQPVPEDSETGIAQVASSSTEGSPKKGLQSKPSLKSLSSKSPSFKVRKVSVPEQRQAVPEPTAKEEESEEEEESDYDEEEDQARQRQEYRKSMAAATFNFDLFDIDDPDNTLTQVLLYLEHQTVQVISTIQDLLTAIKKPDATRGELRENSKAISEVIRQMSDATKTSMNQTRNHQLKEHGSWVVTSLEDCNHRMNALCRPNAEKSDTEFADKNFKQRLAGISFDIAKCTKELVKTVEEASLKEDIAQLDARLNQPDDDLT